MIDHIAAKVADGGRVDAAEALQLYRHAPTHLLGTLADRIRARKHPERVVTYIIDRNVNYTNVCVARCNFCAFYRTVGASDGYVLGFEEIFRKIDETIAVGGNQLLLQGGHNPDLPLAWYEDLFRGIKAKYPDFKLHALSPPEVLHISRLGGISTAAPSHPQIATIAAAANAKSAVAMPIEVLSCPVPRKMAPRLSRRARAAKRGPCGQ